MAKPGPRTGALDHLAFRGSDPDAMMKKLDSLGIRYEHNAGPRLRQLFLQDPDGIIIELNYPA